MSGPGLQTKLLLQAGRLLLEYNECTAAIHRALTSTAKALSQETCHIAVSYGSLSVALGEQPPALISVPELHYNTAVQARVHDILAQVRRGRLDLEAAITALSRAEADWPPHSRWLVAFALGIAAVSLALLLGADAGAAAVAGLATALGLLARREVGRWHVSLLALPLVASLIGALLGGLLIRLGWTQTPVLVLVVPALMVVPGPHLINGLLDLIDNYLAMSLARLLLAMGILLASAAGIVLGVELMLPEPGAADQGATVDRLNLFSDMVLAGIVTCGFAIFYNTTWRHLWMAMVGGMIGHGLRYVALEAGCQMEAATFLGGLAVGVMAAWMGTSRKLPIAALGFAGAVTMIPGLTLYRALVGAMQVARSAQGADAKIIAETIGNALHGSLVVSGLALGFVLGARAVTALAGKRGSSTAPPLGHESTGEGHQTAAGPLDSSSKR